MAPPRFERVSISVVGLIAIVSVTLAIAIIWLILTDPVTVADAVNQGNVSPFVKELAGVILQAVSFNAFSATISGTSVRADNDEAAEELWGVLLHGIGTTR